MLKTVLTLQDSTQWFLVYIFITLIYSLNILK